MGALFNRWRLGLLPEKKSLLHHNPDLSVAKRGASVFSKSGFACRGIIYQASARIKACTTPIFSQVQKHFWGLVRQNALTEEIFTLKDVPLVGQEIKKSH